jgi:hypothetical protein
MPPLVISTIGSCHFDQREKSYATSCHFDQREKSYATSCHFDHRLLSFRPTGEILAFELSGVPAK